MAFASTDDARETEVLLRRAAEGDRESWGTLLVRHRDRLLRMVAVRLDPRLKGRFDASDVVQEACLEASQRLPEYLDRPAVPFFLWLRLLTGQKLVSLHRHHIGAQRRDAGRELSLDPGGEPAASSVALAAQLAGHDPRPSEVAVRAERQARFQTALDGMDPIDREVLSLRHFEQLSNTEAAQVLGLDESAASKRYTRAIRRLREALANLPGGWSEAAP